MSLYFFFVCAPTQKKYRDIRPNAFKLSVGEALYYVFNAQ